MLGGDGILPTKETRAPSSMASSGRGCVCRLVRWTVSFVARLIIWYAVIASLLYCPSPTDTTTELSETKARICHPYFCVRSYLHPHVSSYYGQYAAPYVQVAQPYADKFHETVYVPVVEYTQEKYYKHGDQHVQKAISYAKDKWDRRAGPKVREVADTVRGTYVSVVEPSAQQVIEASVPYQEAAISAQAKAKHHANYIWGFYVDKYNRFIRPFIEQGLAKGHEVVVVVTDKAGPYSKQALSATVGIWTETVRPRITGLYSRNIEPQLVRISQKLATYREARASRANITSTRAFVKSTSAAGSQTTTERAPVYSSETFSQFPSLTPSQKPVVTKHRQAADDLVEWESKFASALDEGSVQLLQKISTIVKQRRTENPIEHALDLFHKLENETESQFGHLKAGVLEIVGSLPADASHADQDAALDRFHRNVISARDSVKTAAQELRGYLRDLDQSVMSEITTATNGTLDVLHEIEIIGLEQVGMRLAWMDNVSYEDWAKYNALKKREPVWKNDIKDIAVLHEGLINFRREASGILSRGLKFAEGAAAELHEIQEIGRWKILAQDDSELFEKPAESLANVRAERRRGLGLDQGEDDIDAESERTVADGEGNAAKRTAPETLRDESENGDDLLTTHEHHADTAYAATSPHSSVWGGAAAAGVDADFGYPTGNDDGFDIDAVLEAEKSRDFYDFVEQSPVPTSGTASIRSRSPIASEASAQLGAALSKATESLSAALAQATGEESLILDAKRRYYEAVGLAHDVFSSTVGSNDASADITATAIDNAAADAIVSFADVDDAERNFASISSMVAASLDAVIYSISSVSTDPEVTRSVVEDATSRYSAALAAATSSFLSASEQLARGSATASPALPEKTGSSGQPAYTILPIAENAAANAGAAARDEL